MMLPDEKSSIESAAKSEIAAEDRRTKIDAAKQRLREWKARPLWQRLFPFKIVRI